MEDLLCEFREELPGILARAVSGCLEWQQDGLRAPAEVTQATSAYRSEMDALGGFLNTCCLLIPNARTNTTELYSAYKDWAEENGERVLSQRRFGQGLVERGFTKKKSNTFAWQGIGLLDTRSASSDSKSQRNGSREDAGPSSGIGPSESSHKSSNPGFGPKASQPPNDDKEPELF